jgi:hypothetical protein
MHYYRIIRMCIEPHVLQQLNPIYQSVNKPFHTSRALIIISIIVTENKKTFYEKCLGKLKGLNYHMKYFPTNPTI